MPNFLPSGEPTPAPIYTPNPAQNGVRGMAVARGAVAENSVLVQFLCCGARNFFLGDDAIDPVTNVGGRGVTVGVITVGVVVGVTMAHMPVLL